MAAHKTMVNQLVGFVAGADLSAKQYMPVKINSTGVVVAATAQAAGVFSILQNDPESGQPCLLPGIGDIVKAKAGANDIAIGDMLTANTSGVIDITTGYVFAQALEDSSAVGDLIQVRVLFAELA